MITNLVDGKINILLISETKIDDTFLSFQFIISGFCLHVNIIPQHYTHSNFSWN